MNSQGTSRPQPPAGDEYHRDRYGRILRDRYGRPVRRRHSNVPPPPPGKPATTPPVSGNQHPARPQSPDQPSADGYRRGTPRSPGNERRYPQTGAAHAPQAGFGTPAPVDNATRALPLPTTPPTTNQGSAQRWRQAQPVAPSRPATPPVPPAPTGRAEKRRPRRRRTGRGCITKLLTLIVVTVLALGAAMLAVDSSINRVAASPAPHIGQTRGTNWLLVGSDSRTGLTEQQVQTLGTGGDLGSTRTDTIMVLHLERGTPATLLSIPRDSYVEIPGYGFDKINAAFTFGGPQLLATTVENSTGLRIDHYMEIGFGGFAAIVDAVGGVTMCLEEPIDDPLANINLPAGCQSLAGPAALGYVRSRNFARGDLDRVEHQRAFIAALVDTIASPAVWLNPFRLIPLMKAGAASVTLGTGDHVWQLLPAAKALLQQPATETVPIGSFLDTEVGSVVTWEDPAAYELFNSLGANW
ncbi:LCP family protein [Corynebacterium choanae]|uniref:Regulatory protein MsrR n=1 Tax=Corynebacterium choanae TaxID=1862358 RepID=A0A3G6J371_9CORY|nr:LCP family protein [Corynebacterium choanae]AZA12521.1 Regulatory protein MsrR [Corynebacterium choanae]